ncbi:TPA: hypothetical protein NJ265_001610 [Vibrio parahaemolyticus]|uniref:hypothetical protein n=2 Tax=Vibrio parahaemolyticus TaxID=670 RepID=UPI001120DFFE|nr:hypothetical protein [Vibrio parahaemolyticus]MBE4438502.1 hypothetical protein [Vibrio parahaemolyticus]MCR9878259.1 hypothetical protein [Vibrio parahaemolyticus]MCR9892281.1 hypothetical protein [Vibrio parahaemolyticus]MCR9955209.1 hypothetical protein [Vibrio parahaemolyticus]MDF5056772.1 hypothetical protein [Vibrio parahaemolyticus]
MKSLLNRTPENKYANTVYAGVGKGENLEALKLWTEGNIITIDPNTQVSNLLKRHHPEVKHYTVALSVEDGEQDFYDYWPESLSTLRDTVSLPNELKNAQLKCTQAVETRSLNSLLSEFDFDSNYNLLVLSINGVELDIINSLSSNELDSFSCIIIQADHKNMYHQSIEYIEKLKSSLVSLGYYLSDMEYDAIFSSFIFFRDEEKKALELENGKLKAEHAKVQEERDKAKNKESELSSRLSHLESNNLSLETRNADLIKQNTELTQAKKLVELESEKLKVERDDAKSQVESNVKQLEEVTKRAEEEEAELVSRLSTLESELEERTKQRDEEHKWHHENKKWAESLTQQIEKVKTKDNERVAHISNLESQISELTTDNKKLLERNNTLEFEKQSLVSNLSSLESENVELTRSTRLNQKMLAKSQVDLDDLRKKYSIKLQSETELVELIKELREKLTIASQYYYQLQQDHPELLAYSDSAKDE